MPDGRIIIIFAKLALPGSVKTRLIPPFSPQEAATFHLAALDDTVRVAGGVADARLELHVAGAGPALRDLAGRYPDLHVQPQDGEDLSSRLTRAFQDAFRSGARRVVILGSDHPTLPSGHLVEAFNHLLDSDLVFGPSRDGGYYAVGVRRAAWPQAQVAFQDIPWSTRRALGASLTRARDAGLSVTLAPDWYDIDAPDDLEALRRDATPESRAARFLREWEGRRAGGGRVP